MTSYLKLAGRTTVNIFLSDINHDKIRNGKLGTIRCLIHIVIMKDEMKTKTKVQYRSRIHFPLILIY